ncbi:MAG TPA: glucose-6-phosphate dehydrogenase [Ignavibacteria bacterium]|nr:glucose-6-phosphate dehydrogenase [Ignavibacteria bacterium]HRJ05615.1 glucose-6-phosphate dehydrogenase [Ignavibacteria bacterium]
MKKPENCVIVIFGASGDLTKRKLIPAIYDLYKQNNLPERFAVLGTASSQFDTKEFRQLMGEAIVESDKDSPANKVAEFTGKLHYFPMDFKNAEGYEKLSKEIHSLSGTCGSECNYIYYLATIPALFPEITVNLGKAGLNKSAGGFCRIIVEKPFGYDLDSAIELNKVMHGVFEEDQIYRIDHYLGKETVQNIMVTRFANGIFEPIWNRNYIHHIEVTSSENIGIENRGGYYETAGALRDMVQSHLLRLVTLIAMEPPSSFDSDAVRNEQLKVLQSLRKLKPEEVDSNVIRGQYISSLINGNIVKAYREEKGVDPESRVETYAAIKFYIDNWRWGSVPFYIRTGKHLPTRVTEAVIHFRKTPHYLFKESQNNSDNQLILRIQPDEGILLKFGMKEPGAGFKVHNVSMDFHYKDITNVYIPEAYERLIYDCMIGDSTLFLRADAVEEAWKFVEPIQKAWADNGSVKIYGYPAGTWGPDVADKLIDGGDNTSWRYPCKNLADYGIYCEL